MKTNNLSESFWRRIKFILLFALGVILLYVLQTKFMVKIPVVDNEELLEAINDYEAVIQTQSEYAEKVKSIHDEIKAMQFDIHQVQKKDEMTKKIFGIRSVYQENEMNSKYFFAIQSANILQIYFDTREERSAMLNNKKVIINNLNECKANI